MLRNTIRNLLFLIGIGIIGSSCSLNSEPADSHEDDPDPPFVCDGYPEHEPNDELKDYNFVNVLPANGLPDPICARLDPFDMDDGADVFYFALQPNCGLCSILTNWVMDTHEDILPYVEFYQSSWNPLGEVDDVHLIGSFYGEPGHLEVLNFFVPYQFPSKRDLYVRITGVLGSPTEIYPYSVQYWTP
jgi:hypothetical protein